jgi:predicted DNA-binding transcriptional regulator AlpA
MATEPLPRPSRALRDVLERADRLSEADLLHLYERLVAELEGQPLGEARREGRLRRRVEALRALQSVRDELGLADGERLTAKVFNEVAPQRVGGWNASRVVRAWGTWRNAADVLAGACPPRRAEREAVTLVRGFRRSSRRSPLDGLLGWISLDPGERGQHAYNAWARARNAELGPDEQRYLGGTGVASAMGMTFALARRQAEVILADEEAPSVRYEVASQALVRLPGFAQKFGLTGAGLLAQTTRTPLPPPVLRHDQHVYWLEDDCERWRKGETVERTEYELDENVLDRARLSQALNLMPSTTQSRYLHYPHLLPAPSGQLDGRPWWSAAVVERWRAEHEGPQANSFRYHGAPIIELGGRRLLTVAAACELLGVRDHQFYRMRRRRPLPAAVAVSSGKLWLEEDVEAYRDERDVERREGELNGLLLDSRAIAERLGVAAQSVLRGIARASNLYPPPDGAIGTSPWWETARFERWLSERQEANQRETPGDRT